MKIKLSSKSKLLIASSVLGILLGAFTTFIVLSSRNVKSVGITKAKGVVEEFLKAMNVPDYKVESIADDKDIYKVELSISGNKFTTYMTKDGRLLFQGAVTLDEIKKANEEATQGQTNTNTEITTKSDKPTVELFVMSHCPYGTQIEKGILPVLETLGDKIDFSLKFVDYAMHDKVEVDEELNQYCINKTEPQKFLTYLKCFLEDGDTQRCLGTTGINTYTVNNCIAQTDAEFKVTESFNNKETWNGGQFPPINMHKEDNTKYSVQGSPTLLIFRQNEKID